MEFISEEDAEYASRIMNGIRLYGKPIRVNKASADKQKAVEIGAELFVGNLDPMVTEQVLYDTFGRFGGLTSLPKVFFSSLLSRISRPDRCLPFDRSHEMTIIYPRATDSSPSATSSLQMQP